MSTKTFITQTALGRRLGLAPATLAARLRERQVKPDGLLIHANKSPGMIFDCERIAELRRVLTAK